MWITNQGGKIEFVNDRDFNFSDGVLDQIAIEYPNAPLCMIQTAEIDVIINEHKIIYNGNSVELKDLFGCIDYFDARSCVFTKDKTTFLSWTVNLEVIDEHWFQWEGRPKPQ